MDQIRFKECVNYPLYFSKHPHQLTKPLKAWEKIVGSLAFVALTLLAGSFFYIKGLRVKVNKEVPQSAQAQKVSKVVQPSFELTPKPANPPAPSTPSSLTADDSSPSIPVDSRPPTDLKKSTADDSSPSPEHFKGVETLINSLKVISPNAQTPCAINELSQCSEEDQRILTQFFTDLENALQQLMTGHQTSVDTGQFSIKSYVDSRELTSYGISLKIKLAIDILDDRKMQGTFEFANSPHVFKGISGASFEEALRSYLPVRYPNFEARMTSRGQIRGLALRPQLKMPSSWPSMDATQRKSLEDNFFQLIKQSKCDESSSRLFYAQIEKCSAYELQALQELLAAFAQMLKNYSSHPQEIVNGSIKMYPQHGAPHPFKYGNVFTLTTTSRVDPSTAFPIASIQFEGQKFYFEHLSIMAIMYILKGNIPPASEVVDLEVKDETRIEGFSFALS